MLKRLLPALNAARCQRNVNPSARGYYRHWKTLHTSQAYGHDHANMNRPRNRQSRPDRGSRGRGGSGGNPSGERSSRMLSNVPSTSQVVTGAAVSIVLKQDQSTGREVQGIVQDILTSGNHPRGIKVRLSDGRVGRVQRMADEAVRAQTPQRADRSTHSSTIDNNQPELPQPRTLADFMPQKTQEINTGGRAYFGTQSPTARCPICNEFEGDEIAVSRHVEKHFER